MAPGEAAGASGATRRRRWWRLRRRWRMLGVFEIGPEHELHHLTSMMKEGLRASLQVAMETPAQDPLTTEHLRAAETQTHDGFELRSFAAPVFAGLRRRLDVPPEDYMSSLCSGCYLQFVSNSKSKADFFITNDKRFFLKTQSRREVRFLLSNLQAYMDHLEKYPHSLLVRFLGVHRIVVPNQIKKYFIVMQSVFYPDERINVRYDIKGCEVGRWTNPDTDGTQIIKVLKDRNFEGQHISLGQDTAWFVRQVKEDVAFLQGLNVLDYSVLLAHQPLHRDEMEGKQSLANLVIRATMSVDFDSSPTGPDPPPAPWLEETLDEMVPEAADGGWSQEQGLPLQDFHQHHHRLLPRCKNAVHVIDGPSRRYFVGIIDIFTVYNWKKRLESAWKSLRYPGRAFSTVRPPKYSRRLCQWVQDHCQ